MPSVKEKLHAMDCAYAYDQWFSGVRLDTPERLAEAERGYEEACRRSYEYRLGSCRKRKEATG